MTGYHAIFGVLLVLMSAALLTLPRQVWGFTHNWRFADPGAVRLTEGYVLWLRLSGAVGVVLGIGLLTYAFR
jgi:hypothetical protein